MRWWGNRIRVRNTAGIKVLVKVACVDDITWVKTQNFKIGATTTGAGLEAALEYAARNALVTERFLEAGESHKFSLAVGKKAYVTITSAADEKEVFCKNEVVEVPWTVKSKATPSTSQPL